MDEWRDEPPAAGPARAVTGLGASFDHVAVAAPRIRDLLPLYRDLLGGEFAGGGDNPGVGYRGLQLSYANRHRVELMEPLAGSTFLDSFFARTGGGGLHHVTFVVPDIHSALDALAAAGFTPTGVNLGHPAWQEVFLHPKETTGVLVQLVQTAGKRSVSGTLDDVLAGRGPHGTGQASP